MFWGSLFWGWVQLTEFRPPLYNEIGKKSRDLVSNGFYFGVLSLDVKTRSHKNIELSTSLTENMEESRVHGSVEAKYSLAQYNLALTEKLHKNCLLDTELSYKSKLLNGLTYTLGGSLSAANGLKKGLLKAEWSGRNCSATSDFEIGKNFSFLTSSLVVGSGGVFAGFQWKYDINKDKQTDLHFVFGYIGHDFHVHTCLNAGRELGGAIYHRIAPEMEVGIDVKLWPKSPEYLYGVACRYVIDKNLSIRGKISNNHEMGLSYEQKLSRECTLTMSTLFDTRNVIVGKQKFGLGLRFEL